MSNVRNKSESGTFPNGWEVKSIGDICHAVLDCHHSTPNWTESGYLVVRNQNIRDGKLDLSAPSFTDRRNFVERTRRATPAFGDLIITREAPMGLVCLVPEALECCLGQRMVLLRPKRTEVVPSYLLYTLLGQSAQNAIAVGGGAGSTVSNLRIPVLKSIEISAPSLVEQTAIATALSDVDVLLDSLDRLIAKKRDLKQAAMQQLLTGQTRLPGFSGEWEVKRLGEIGEVSGSGVDKKTHPDETPVRLVNYMDVYRLGFIESGHLDHWVTARSDQLRRCSVDRGDVFFTPSSETRQDIANSSVAMEDIADAVYSYHVVRLRLKENWDLKYSAYAFKTREFLNQAEKICDGGGTRYVISLGKFRVMTLPVPPIPEQEAIGKILFDMELEIKKLYGQREKTAALKQGMMQELLTGRTRLV